MLNSHAVRIIHARYSLALFLCLVENLSIGPTAWAQFGGRGASGSSPSAQNLSSFSSPTFRDHEPVFTPKNAVPVGAVKILGNETIPPDKISAYLRTRKDRPFDPEIVQADVRRLMSTRLFQDVKTYQNQIGGRVIITFEVIERPTIREIHFVGNQKIKDKSLLEESDLHIGDSVNQFSIQEAQRRIEEYYLSKGFPKVYVVVLEGDRPGDRRVVFSINEGNLQKIYKTQFVGNEIASDARLKTQIESKPGILWIFKGQVNRDKIDEDVEKLTLYYRNLGFFRARVGRDYEFDESGKWMTLTFVIDEGPRYKVRNVAFVGNSKYSDEELAIDLALQEDDFFDMRKMNRDVSKIRDIYGSQGHIFADIQADPRFFEEPGQLDLVYDIQEGSQYRVGRINVKIAGENPHTRHSVIFPRIGFQPGDIIDIRKVRKSERRLKSAQIFAVDPSRGISPQIVIRPPEQSKEKIAQQAGYSNARGQSPEPSSPVGSNETFHRRTR